MAMARFEAQERKVVALEPARAERSDPADRSPGTPAIGDGLLVAQNRLLSLAAELKALAGGPPAAAIDQITAALSGSVCRIAVIGQMKAGKSSLINALVRRPNLLPSNVNPWTGVVTRLHFARPGGPESGMTFRFFSEAEWQDLTAAGGPLGRILERIEPGIVSEELAREGALIGERASRRIGRLFRHLLDREHNYATVSSRVLSRYVCSSEFYDDGPRDFGRFADITKSADVFLESAPFALPTVLVDTPGINDPFLLREQMTGRVLGEADLYLVVLNAEQALADTDLTLLRQLHGVHKDRVILFVNRVDALNDTVGDCAKVLASVRRQIQAEFPGTDLPIVAGSAWWGEQAAKLEADGVGRLLSPNLLGFADHLDVMPLADANRSLHGDEPPVAVLRDVAWRCSGMPELGAVISRLLAVRVGSQTLGGAIAGLKEASYRVETIMVGEQQALRAVGDAAGGTARANNRQLRSIQKNVGRLDGLADRLTAAGKAAEEELALMIEVGVEGIRIQLERTVAAFADAEAAALEAAGFRQKVQRTWRCNIRPLRQALGEQFLEAYRRLGAELQATQATVSRRVHRLFDEAAPGYDLELNHGPPAPLDPSPSIAALGQVLALDFGSPWHQWLTLWRRANARPERLRRLVVSEFQLVIDELMASATAMLEAHVTNAGERFRSDIAGTMALLRTRQKELAGVYKGLLEERRGRSSSGCLDDHQARLDACQNRIAALADQRRRMDAILHALQHGRHL
jgi:hypothetical protein